MCQESDSSPLQLDPLEDYTSPISKLEPPEIDACFSISEVDCIQTNQE